MQNLAMIKLLFIIPKLFIRCIYQIKVSGSQDAFINNFYPFVIVNSYIFIKVLGKLFKLIPHKMKLKDCLIPTTI